MSTYTMPGWRRKNRFSVKKNEKQCLWVSCMCWDLHSITLHFWESPVPLHSNRCWPRILFSLPSSRRERSHFQRQKHSPSRLHQHPQLVLWSGVSWSHSTLGGNQKPLFSQGKKSNRKSQLPLENIIISLPVWVRIFSGHGSFLILPVREMLVINLEILMKDYRVISALENCNVFKCLT